MRYLSLLFIILTTNLWGQSQKKLDSLKLQITFTRTTKEKALLFSEISWQYASNKLDSSCYYADKAIVIAKKLNDLDILADAYNSKGLANDYSGKLSESLIWYNKSLKIRKQQDNITKISNVYNNIGASYYYNSQYEKALSNYLQALYYREKENDSLGIAQSYNNIGLVHRTQKNFKLAQYYYKKSFEIKEALNDLKGMIYPLTNLSVLAQNQNNYSQAEFYIRKALNISETKGFENETGIQKSNLGVNYLLQKEYIKAIDYLKQAEIIFENNNNKKTLGIIHFKLAEAYFGIKKFEIAEKELIKALFLAEKFNKHELRQNVLYFLSKLSFQQQDYKNAYSYLYKSNTVKDSIFSVEKYKALSELEKKYQTVKKEQQIQTLKLKLEKDKVHQRLWLIGGFLASLLIIMLFLFLYLNKKKSNKLSIALNDKETLLKEIHHRVKNNLQIVSSLLNLQTRYMKDKTAINAVKDSKNRVNSMALIHQKLYQHDSLTGIEMHEYISDLSYSLADSFGLQEDQMTINVDTHVLDVDTVIPIGLILNELIINAIKHASNDSFKLIVNLFDKKKHLLLQVIDNGIGLKDNYDFTKSTTYGMKLIQSLARRIDADIHFENDDGLIVTLLIKDYKLIS